MRKEVYNVTRSKGGSVLVYGLGKSGRAVTDLLALSGFKVKAIDENPVTEVIDYMEKALEMGVSVCTGRVDEKELEKTDFIVVSPGIPPSNRIITSAIKKGLPVLSEFEVAWQLLKKRPFKTIAVTGTNGKSTVVRLLGDIFSESKNKCIVAGNIGTPLAAVVGEIDENTILVLEVSSFQLYFTYTFVPDVSIVLNITQDHLDWHKSFEEYVNAKAKLIELTDKNGFCILNADDENVVHISGKSNGKNVWFSMERSEHIIPPKAYFKDGEVVIDDGESLIATVERNSFKPIGIHNDYNLLAATAAAYFGGATVNEIRKGVENFRPLPHRMEMINSYKGIRFIDDSKATNPDAVIKALEGMDGKCVVILGGKNKGNEFSGVAKKVKEKCIGAVTLGESAGEIEKYLEDEGVFFVRASDMENTVKLAILFLVLSLEEDGKTLSILKDGNQDLDETLKKVFSEVKRSNVGGTVLLSPGCASFDMFEDYSHRGEAFKESVQRALNLIGQSNVSEKSDIDKKE